MYVLTFKLNSWPFLCNHVTTDGWTYRTVNRVTVRKRRFTRTHASTNRFNDDAAHSFPPVLGVFFFFLYFIEYMSDTAALLRSGANCEPRALNLKSAHFKPSSTQTQVFFSWFFAQAHACYYNIFVLILSPCRSEKWFDFNGIAAFTRLGRAVREGKKNRFTGPPSESNYYSKYETNCSS